MDLPPTVFLSYYVVTNTLLGSNVTTNAPYFYILPTRAQASAQTSGVKRIENLET